MNALCIVKNVSTTIFATLAICFLAGCAGKNGDNALNLDYKQRTVQMKINRTSGPVYEKIQRQCVKEVSAKRVARGGAPLEIVETDNNSGLNELGAKAATVGTMMAFGSFAGLLAIPAVMFENERKAEMTWIEEEMKICINGKYSAEMQKEMTTQMKKTPKH
jgi:hypothetical protein